MKRLLSIMLMLVLSTYSGMAQTQNNSEPVYVIIHGAWGGSWAFKEVDSLLTEKGCIVYRASLTGLGDRVHLATPEIGLRTHVKDVVNLILFENLRNVILVGHSYGGMVTSGVADSIPGRIKKTIYVDAFVPKDGESIIGITSRADQFSKMNVHGFLIPGWVPADKLPPRDVPHPYKTFTDTLTLQNKEAKKVPGVYILSVEKNKLAKEDDFYNQSERAKANGWKVIQLEADHNPQWSAPIVFADVLFSNR